MLPFQLMFSIFMLLNLELFLLKKKTFSLSLKLFQNKNEKAMGKDCNTKRLLTEPGACQRNLAYSTGSGASGVRAEFGSLLLDCHLQDKW